ncbi:unnamed protein product [Aphis gossypii]|uniref:Uncharacterized protein n=1 Tax=Aphis gossypii TaxID=80765 RepID=A0A9P0J8F0_APHGO|nr:unnamed protein product [Aphis gossypii]
MQALCSNEFYSRRFKYFKIVFEAFARELLSYLLILYYGDTRSHHHFTGSNDRPPLTFLQLEVYLYIIFVIIFILYSFLYYFTSAEVYTIRSSILPTISSPSPNLPRMSRCWRLRKLRFLFAYSVRLSHAGQRRESFSRHKKSSFV